MSIYNKIRIIFLVAALLATAFFSAFFFIQRTEHIQRTEKRYTKTSLYLHRHFRQHRAERRVAIFGDPNLRLYLSESDFSIVQDRVVAGSIMERAIQLHERNVFRSKIKVLHIKNQLYLAIQNPRYRLLLEDKQKVSFPWQTLLWYIAILLFLSLLYLWLTRSLRPLKRLEQQMQQVAAGDLSLSVKSDKSDEIAKVANAFDDALRKLESLINSRQLFLRSIMHELKTPIAKGKLLNAFLDEGRQKQSYEMVFERLELLIEEFSKIEKMLSSSYTIKRGTYNARDIIDHALELMILSEEEIVDTVTIQQEVPLVIETDFELMALALKNLIDNAIKYAPDHKVIITIHSKSISITNRGERFTETLEPYQQPFQEKSNGLGLGLYIVQSIMQMLKVVLNYSHHDEKNSFSVIIAQ